MALTLPRFQLPAFTVWQIMAGWRETILAQLNYLPALSLSPAQWLPLLAAALIIWLAGNRLLFTTQDGEIMRDV